MTSSFDDPAAPAASAKEEKIDMSDYSSMLGGINDNMTTNTAQYDPSWDLKMMEGLKDNDDDDDEMSSDNVILRPLIKSKYRMPESVCFPA